jgi:hypothetical protein
MINRSIPSPSILRKDVESASEMYEAVKRDLAISMDVAEF